DDGAARGQVARRALAEPRRPPPDVGVLRHAPLGARSLDVAPVPVQVRAGRRRIDNLPAVPLEKGKRRHSPRPVRAGDLEADAGEATGEGDASQELDVLLPVPPPAPPLHLVA